MAYYLNGQKLTENQPFAVGDYTYPWSYLEILSTTQLAAMGITQLAPASGFDPRYYFDINFPRSLDDREEVDPVTGDPLYVKVWDPEAVVEGIEQLGAMVDSEERLISKGLKTTCTAEIKTTVGSLLEKTDWYVYRKSERNIDIPEDIATQRAALIAEADRLETAISGVTTVEELADVMSSQGFQSIVNPTL